MLSLVIPTYNENQNIGPLIRRITSALEPVIDKFEIIVLDDDSPDGTWQVAEQIARENSHLRVIRRCGERGLGTAVIAGWQAAKGELLGVMDGDLQHPPETLPDLLDSMLNTNADIVVASRYIDEGGISTWRFSRRFISWLGTFVASLMLPNILRLVQDPMSGYFLIRRLVIEDINLRPEGYKILLEVLSRGKYQTVVEVPYVFEARKEGRSKLGPRQYFHFIIHIGRLARETGELGRFLRFCTIGFSGVLVNEGALKFFTDVGGVYYIYSSILAVEIAVISNFFFNDIWTFGDKSNQQPGTGSRVKRFLKFNLICATGACLNIAILWALTYLGGLYYLSSNLFGIVASTIWNYSMNYHITWGISAKHESREVQG